MNTTKFLKPNPYETANLISKLLFWWIVPLLWKGYRQVVSAEDLFRPLEEDESKRLGDQLERAWNHEIEAAKRENIQPKLLKALFAVFGVKYILYSSISAFAECGVRVGQIMLLKYVVASFNYNNIVNQDPDAKYTKQYLYTAGLCISAFLWILVQYPSLFCVMHLGMKLRIGISSLIYRKALRLSQVSNNNNQTTIGQLVNLLSNDVSKFDFGLFETPYLIIGPLQMIILTILLWLEIGYSCLGGIGFIILFLLVRNYNGKKLANLGHKIAERNDERGRLMNEIIIAIHVIKMYGWEKPFAEMVDRVRKFQVKVLCKAAYLRGIYESLYLASAKMVPTLTLLIFYLTTEQTTLTADQLFFMVAIFNTVRNHIIQGFLPACDIWVALGRIETLLLLEEHCVPSNLNSNNNVNPESNVYTASIIMNNVCASWPSSSSIDRGIDKLTLDSVSINVHGDLLFMIVGAVGSGKTSLLHTIIKELPISSGTFELNGSISYATQEPWIFTGNLKQNILFGLNYNEKRYKEVIEICALKDDLKQLPFGDNTIVGELGIVLSGGQKARINLARTLYREADIYLLDDPLSAVDAKVSVHIFEKCVKKYLKGKLRILVTHQLQYLSQADYILVINQGHVLAQGSYKELISNGIDFMSFTGTTTTNDLEAEWENNVMSSNNKDAEQKLVELLPLPAELEEEGENELADQKPEIHVEEIIIGTVGLKLYWKYFKSGGSIFQIILIALGFIFVELLLVFSDIWLTIWINVAEEEKKAKTLNSNSSKSDSDSDTTITHDLYIYIFSGTAVLIFMLQVGLAIFFFVYCTKIGIKLHDKMFKSLIRAPTKFFDNNPSGRVMNRFTKDVGSMDEILPATMFDAISIIFIAFGVIVIVCVSNYVLIAPSVIVVLLLWYLRKFYISTASVVKKIEAIGRSPMFTHLASSIQGLSTIRASNAQQIFIDQFDTYQDLHSSAWYIFIISSRWFGMWIEIVCVTFLVVVSITFILLGDSSVGCNVGLAISSIMGFTGVLKYGINKATETENLMTSVERALEYAKLKPEAPLDSLPGKKPPYKWPENGSITFKQVDYAYDSDKDILKGLTFEIKAKEKIGIIGRTGAGKSSIIAALFRMTEPRAGKIYIDDICINDIGLHELRQNISIIPQDPILFNSTVRYNLDPFNQFNDLDLWKVLKDVELKETVKDSLDFKVSDGGNNFSVGQKQLICLARAILRRNKIIVMDEATANVDPKTDNFIQKTIRTKFADCTIITIAHRLHSVMDCDKILVLHNGYLKEYDHPFVLLQNSQGYFSSMVAQTGSKNAAILNQVAKQSYMGEGSSEDWDSG